MKKLVCLFLCIILCFCVASCSKAPEEISLNEENISEYVSVEVTFGEVDVADNEKPTHNEKYYLTCLATISIKPKGNYTFENVSVSCALNEGGRWSPIKSSGKMKAVDFQYDWHGSINLDKDGYGEKTVSIFCYSDTYDKIHPSSANWECFAFSASGTAIKN